MNLSPQCTNSGEHKKYAFISVLVVCYFVDGATF